MPNRQTQNEAPETFAAFVGIDWADQNHAVCLLDGDHITQLQLDHSPEAIAEWAAELHQRFGGRAVAVALEQARGGLVHALMQYPHLVLFPLNPAQLAHYRSALATSGKKDDPSDAWLLAHFLREHHPRLRPWMPDDPDTRELAHLCQLRRKTVDLRKKVVQQLTSTLKTYYPQALQIAGPLHQGLALELLRRWPSLGQLQRAHPSTLRQVFRRHGRRNPEQIDQQIKALRALTPLCTDPALVRPAALFVQMLVAQIQKLGEAIDAFDQQIAERFGQHPDAPLFRALPGAGDALAPRLLTAFGTRRDRFHDAGQVQCLSGIAPVTRRSGKHHRVRRRFACPKFLRQTFHEFADHARKWSPWSKAYYQFLRQKGHQHHAALRALAFKWIRILFRLWKNRELYDEAKYLRQLKAKNSPVVPFLDLA